MIGDARQARRDAATVEIGFAVCTGALLAGALFCLVGAPALLLDLDGGTERAVVAAAWTAATAGFALRVARVLWRFTRAGAGSPVAGPPGPASTASAADRPDGTGEAL
ncbi:MULTISPECIES: DUF6332 family protein [unclassified Streptomyces]|uniref:DUF6332 family protein n=1 Tax=unclassified Streptomyces TaxID=2593676 RepID=UPI000D1B65E9|nr:MULTISPECIES: DUF6332 family protein [unclassified Streptomyces]